MLDDEAYPQTDVVGGSLPDCDCLVEAVDVRVEIEQFVVAFVLKLEEGQFLPCLGFIDELPARHGHVELKDVCGLEARIYVLGDLFENLRDLFVASREQLVQTDIHQV